MKRFTNSIDTTFDRLNLSGKTRQWAWFAVLWIFSLSCVLLLGYTIKFFMGLI